MREPAEKANPQIWDGRPVVSEFLPDEEADEQILAVGSEAWLIGLIDDDDGSEGWIEILLAELAD
jgi:hypothetical protein